MAEIMKPHFCVLLVVVLVAAFIMEAQAEESERDKKAKGRLDLRIITCREQQLVIPEPFLKNVDDCIMNKVLPATSETTNVTGPVKKGMVCDIACYLQTNNVLNAEFKINDKTMEETIAASFKFPKLEKRHVAARMTRAEKKCRNHLEEAPKTDDETCSRLKPYVTCLQKKYIKICTKRYKLRRRPTKATLVKIGDDKLGKFKWKELLPSVNHNQTP